MSERTEAMVRAKKQGKRIKDIAAEFGVSSSAVCQAIARAGCAGSKREAVVHVVRSAKPEPDQRKQFRNGQNFLAYTLTHRNPPLPLPVFKVPKDEPAPIGEPDTLGPGCKWIAGETNASGWRQCGHERAGGSAYCPHHHQRAYTGRSTFTRTRAAGNDANREAERALLKAMRS